MTIICTGSIAFDYLMTFPGYFRDHILPEHLESISLSFLVDSMIRQRGGTAPNIAYALARLNHRPLLVGTVGEDFCDYREWLEENGVDTSYTREIPGDFTASFFVNTDLSNAQIASFYTGAMAKASTISLHEIKSITPDDLVVISPNDPKAMDMYVRECKEMNIPYVYDPGQQVVRSDPAELKRGTEGAYALFVNDYEYQLLQKHTSMSEKDILSCVKFMVVTCGEKGSHIYTDDGVIEVPVFPPDQILDPTGVGDAYRGGFLRGYMIGLDWKICGEMGALSAAYCLEQRGTQGYTYSPIEYIQRYRKMFDDKGAIDILIK